MASSNNYECDKHDEVVSHENDLSIEKEGTSANWRLESARNESSNRCRSSSGTKNQRRGIGGNWRTTTGDNHKDTVGLEHLSLGEAYSENRVHGFWRIRCTLGKEAEDMWDALNELHAENSLLFPVPPRRWLNKNYASNEHIESFISPSSDKEQIKEAADAIRNKIEFSFLMSYFGRTKLNKYIHTPENEFYELENEFWKIALSDFATHLFPPNEVILTSQLLTNNCPYFPPSEEAIKKMKSSISGKWLVPVSFGKAEKDDLWITLISLCKDSILMGMEVETRTDSEVILCYTADANDMDGVKKAGDAIRKVIPNDYIMYYKPNTPSEEGRNRKDGYKSPVTSYMNTANGSFYGRDQFKRWMLTKTLGV